MILMKKLKLDGGNKMNKEHTAKMIDHTILTAEATESEIIKLCKEAIHYDFASVCLNPAIVPVAAK